MNEFIYNWNGTNYTIYNDSLVLMYNFDNISELGENSTYVVDVSNGEHIGTCSECPILTNGKYGGGINFSNNNEHIDVGTDPSLDLGNNFSASAWIKPNSLIDYAGIIGKVAPVRGVGTYSYIFVCHGDGTIGARGTDPEAWNFGSNASISPGNWYHLVWVVNETHVSYYVNGVSYGSDSYGYIDNSEHHVYIGSWFDPTVTYDFNGTIDEIRLWNKTLSQNEISNLYSSNLNKYDTDKWSFYTNISNLSDGDYTYQVFAMDNSFFYNQTDLRTLTIGLVENPLVSFVDPTPINGFYTQNNFFQVNINTTQSTLLKNFTWNWDDTNYSIFDENLVLMINGDNVSLLGENSSNTVDVSKTVNNGTFYNNVRFTDDGKFNGALEFDGNNDYIDFGSDPEFDMGDSFTASAWIKRKNLEEHSGIISKVINTRSGTYSFLLDVDPNGSLMAYSIESGFIYSSNASLLEDVWYHVAWVYGNGNITFYVNGDNFGTSLFNYTDNPDHHIFVGSWYNPVDNYDFNGTIDEIRIWDKSLTQEELQVIYSSNLNKYDIDKWFFYKNQTNMSVGSHTYQAFLTNSPDESNQTEQRTITRTLAPIVTLNSPTDNNSSIEFNSDTVFNCTATDSDGIIVNTSLYSNLNGSWQLINTSYNSGRPSVDAIFSYNIHTARGNNSFTDGGFVWNCLAFNNYSNSDFSENNYTISSWGLGTHNNTIVSDIYLTLDSVTSGNYTSKVFDSLQFSNWNISWSDTVQELLSNKETVGVINMSNNILLYHFNNNSALGENSFSFNDFSGEDNDGYCYNNECPILVNPGIFKNSYNFDGIDDIIRLGNNNIILSDRFDTLSSDWILNQTGGSINIELINFSNKMNLSDTSSTEYVSSVQDINLPKTDFVLEFDLLYTDEMLGYMELLDDENNILISIITDNNSNEISFTTNDAESSTKSMSANIYKQIVLIVYENDTVSAFASGDDPSYSTIETIGLSKGFTGSISKIKFRTSPSSTGSLLIDELRVYKPDLAIIGDSITDGKLHWSTHPSYPAGRLSNISNETSSPGYQLQKQLGSNYWIGNRAFGGSRLNYINGNITTSLISQNFKKVYLSAGHNDIMNGDTLEAMQGNFTEIISKLNAVNISGNNIVVGNIFPSGYLNTEAEMTMRTDWNTWLQQQANINDWIYIDLSSTMEDPSNSSKLNPLYDYGDGTHLNPLGSNILAQKIANVTEFGNNILNSSFSVESWINTSGTGTIINNINNIRDEVNSSWVHSVNSEGYYEVTLISSSNNMKKYRTNTKVNDSNIHHVAFTWDVISNNLSLFLDGSKSSVTKITDNSLVDNELGYFQGTFIGGLYNKTNLFNGIIDEVAIYNRSLSEKEIYDRYSKRLNNLSIQIRTSNNGSSFTDWSNFLNNPSDNIALDVRYLQYRVFMSANNASVPPYLFNISFPYSYSVLPPQYSNNQTNSTEVGTNILHSLYWEDQSELSGYIFSFDNGTGEFVNDSWVSMTGTANWSNVSKIVNSTVGSTIRWCVYANDSSDNWNGTSCEEPFSYTTIAGDTCSPTSPLTDNYVFECSDNCNITTNLDFANYNVTWNGTGTWNLYANVSGFNRGFVYNGCKIYVNSGGFK